MRRIQVSSQGGGLAGSRASCATDLDRPRFVTNRAVSQHLLLPRSSIPNITWAHGKATVRLIYGVSPPSLQAASTTCALPLLQAALLYRAPVPIGSLQNMAFCGSCSSTNVRPAARRKHSKGGRGLLGVCTSVLRRLAEALSQGGHQDSRLGPRPRAHRIFNRSMALFNMPRLEDRC